MEEKSAFSGFGFLTGDSNPAPVEKTKTKAKAKEEDEPKGKAGDDLSEVDLAALEKAAAAQIEAKNKKAVTIKVDNEEEEEEGEKLDEPKGKTDNKPKATPKAEVEEDSNSLADFAFYMAEKGILDVDDDAVINTEEDLEKIQIKTIQNGINSYKESIPEDGQKFLEFLEQGGKPSDFHKYYYAEASFEDYQMETEEDKKYIIEEYLKLEDTPDEDIQDEINALIDTDRLDKKATTYLNKLRKIESDNKKMLLESQKQHAKEQEALRKAEWDGFKKGLFDKEEISGFKLTPKSKQEIWDYMTKPVNKKTGETQYQTDTKENSDARYIFAYLLKNKWNIESLERQVETKAVGKLKAKLNNYSDFRAKNKSPRSNAEVETDPGNPFKAFSGIL